MEDQFAALGYMVFASLCSFVALLGWMFWEGFQIARERRDGDRYWG